MQFLKEYCCHSLQTLLQTLAVSFVGTVYIPTIQLWTSFLLDSMEEAYQSEFNMAYISHWSVVTFVALCPC